MPLLKRAEPEQITTIVNAYWRRRSDARGRDKSWSSDVTYDAEALSGSHPQADVQTRDRDLRQAPRSLL